MRELTPDEAQHYERMSPQERREFEAVLESIETSKAKGDLAAQIAELTDGLGIEEPKVFVQAPAPVQPAQMTEEQFRQYKNRVKANRSNMLKRLMKRFEIYQVFSPEEAATRTGVALSEMTRYLESESQIVGSRIRRAPIELGYNRFNIVSAFDNVF